MLVEGYDGGSLDYKIGFSNSLWLYARYTSWDDSSPFLFHAAAECGVYKLQNTYAGLDTIDPNDDHWVGLENCGQYLRSIHNQTDGTLFRFTEQADGTYKMQNELPVSGVSPWVSYTNSYTYTPGHTDDCPGEGVSGQYPYYSLRATYSEDSAMKVSLNWE